MKSIVLLLLVSALSSFCYGQEKNFIDQPYLETTASIDTLVTPDRVWITITLNENDSKNKKSTEELEQVMVQKLKELGIDTEKDLSLLDFSSAFKSYFLKGVNIVKIKNYALLLHDAITAGRVIMVLEEAGISNVTIEKLEYTRVNSLLLELKSKAVLKAKQNAISLLEPLNQKPTKAIYVSDTTPVTNALQSRAAGVQIRGVSSIYGSRAPEPALIDFQKIRFETQVIVRFAIQ